MSQFRNVAAEVLKPLEQASNGLGLVVAVARVDDIEFMRLHEADRFDEVDDHHRLSRSPKVKGREVSDRRGVMGQAVARPRIVRVAGAAAKRNALRSALSTSLEDKSDVILAEGLIRETGMSMLACVDCGYCHFGTPE